MGPRAGSRCVGNAWPAVDPTGPARVPDPRAGRGISAPLLAFAPATGLRSCLRGSLRKARMTGLDGVLYKEILDQGLREFPNECCGLIAAESGSPIKVFPMRNADASPATYRLDGKEQLRIFQVIDDRGWELWAIYHSHTHSEAYPSDTDVRLAFYPDA